MVKIKNTKIVIWTDNELEHIKTSMPVISYLKKKGANITLVGVHKSYLESLKQDKVIDDYIVYKHKENRGLMFLRLVKVMFDIGMVKADTMIVLRINSIFNYSDKKMFFGVNNYCFINNSVTDDREELNKIILKKYFRYDIDK